jgi:hypothetical protein
MRFNNHDTMGIKDSFDPDVNIHFLNEYNTEDIKTYVNKIENYIDGYMKIPVCVYGGKQINSKSALIENIKDLEKEFELLKTNNDVVLLYQIGFRSDDGAYIRYATVNS